MIASRRIASYVDGRQQWHRLYLVRTSRQQLCLLQVSNGAAGGSCVAPDAIFNEGKVWAVESHLLAGVAANDVARVQRSMRSSATYNAVPLMASRR